MNFIDAAGTLADSAILLIRDGAALDAKNHVRNVVAEYDALAPDWNRAPKYAKHYAIDADGAEAWYRSDPFLSTAIGEETFWQASGDYKETGKIVKLPIGVDWRLCKWSREATQ